MRARGTPADDGLRLRCPSCTTSFLNIPPEKLLLGTSTFQADLPPFPPASAPHGPASPPRPGHLQEHAQQELLRGGTEHAGVPGQALQQGQVGPGQEQEQEQEPQPGHIGVAPTNPQIQQLQLERQRQQAKADTFARPFPIHCVVDEQDVLEVGGRGG